MKKALAMAKLRLEPGTCYRLFHPSPCTSLSILVNLNPYTTYITYNGGEGGYFTYLNSVRQIGTFAGHNKSYEHCFNLVVLTFHQNNIKCASL